MVPKLVDALCSLSIGRGSTTKASEVRKVRINYFHFCGTVYRSGTIKPFPFHQEGIFALYHSACIKLIVVIVKSRERGPSGKREREERK